MNNELKKFLRDPRFLVPLFVLVGFEGFLQTPVYKFLLRPESYAENVNRNVGFVERSTLQPNVLVLGTSVAYQGLNMPLLGQELAPRDLRVLSGASQGALLITQHSIYRYLREKLPSVRLVVHVSETTFPWTARHLLDASNRSMLAQFPRRQVVPLLFDYDFHLTQNDRTYLLIRSVTYQNDLRDFVLNPLERIKQLGRKYRQPVYASEWGHENRHRFRLSAYGARDLQECLDFAKKGIPEKDAAGNQVTDKDHRQALIVTCEIGLRDPINRPGAAQWNELFFKQLKLFHDEVRADGRQVLTVFPPYSSLIPDLNRDDRLNIWRKGLQTIYGNRPFYTADLRRSLDGPDNGDLFYDTIHLNREGALRFTRAFAEMLSRRAPAILGGTDPGTAAGAETQPATKKTEKTGGN